MINSVDTRLSTTESTRRAGNVSVTAAGDITMTGGIDLHASTEARRGSLSLTAGSQGTVILASLDMDRVKIATIASGKKRNRLTGAVNVDLTNSGGSGTTVSPVLLTTTRLRMNADQRLYYLPENNPSLEGKAYRVADAGGNAGQGGLLMVEPTAGTVFRVR